MYVNYAVSRENNNLKNLRKDSTKEYGIFFESKPALKFFSNHDDQLKHLEWGYSFWDKSESTTMQGRGTNYIQQVSLESYWLLQYST